MVKFLSDKNLILAGRVMNGTVRRAIEEKSAQERTSDVGYLEKEIEIG